EQFWPKPMPENWILGQVSGIAVDPNDHVWLVHRPRSLVDDEKGAIQNPPATKCCKPAPAVMKFDQEGNLLASWGGPGQGYDWPDSNHGITIDYKGNVWIGGNGVGTAPGARGRGAGRGQPAGGQEQNEEQAGSAIGYTADTMVLKFTQAGKFLMQIGKQGTTKGSNDIDNLRRPAKIFIDKQANEAYIADGYGNHRVIVYDADTGKYKRHWGAYGK